MVPLMSEKMRAPWPTTYRPLRTPSQFTVTVNCNFKKTKLGTLTSQSTLQGDLVLASQMKKKGKHFETYVLLKVNFEPKRQQGQHRVFRNKKNTHGWHPVHLHRGTTSSSISRDQRDHSICRAVMGWTACARLIVFTLASERPIYLTFPSSTSFFISPTCYTHKSKLSEHL
jgi:hypothetical protein